MEPRDERQASGNKSRDADVPDKQMYRWKDDGGALPPEPEPESDPDQG